jgi:hypothetical protein
MRVKSTVTLIAVWVLSCANAMGADPAPNAVQIGVGYHEKITCTSSPVSIDELGKAYFGVTTKKVKEKDVPVTLQEVVTKLLNGCKELNQETLQPYTVVVFLARPTENAPQTTVVHFIYNKSQPLPLGSTALPGIKNASWIYVTSDDLQTVASQLVASPIENPIFSQLGSLFGALEKPFEKISLKASQASGEPLYLHVTPSVDLQYARSSIVETDALSVPKRDKDFKLLNADGKNKDSAGKDIADADAVYTQVPGSVTFTNTPKTIMTVNAAVGVLIGSPSGDKKMKVDNKLYAADPLTRGMAMAGITLHAPYDATALSPTPAAVIGLFVGGVVSPSAGLATALSIGWKGISFLAGGAAFFIQTAPDGKTLGASADGVSPQLVNGTSYSAFIGASYAFK